MFVVLIRTIVLYLFIVVGIRLLGKHQIGQLEPSELVLALIIADLAAVPMQDFGIPLLSGIIPIMTLLCVTMIISVLSMRSIRFRSLVCGRPSIIIENGKLRQEELRKNRLTVDEVMEELRMKSITDISTVKYAILETNGQLSVLPFASQQPPTASDLGVTGQEPGLPLVIINDGRVLERNLHIRGYDQNWLNKQLKAHGVKHPQQVYLLTADELGRVYFAPMEVKK